MRQRSLFVVLTCLLLIAIVPMSSAQDDRLQVVGSHSILTDVIANVAGDAADVTSLMPLGADPHSFQPTPSDLTALADADVVFINGMMFEEGLLETIENAADGMNLVTASACVEIIPFGGHDHDHEEGEEHDHEGEEHDHEGEEASAEAGEMSAIAQLCATHYAEMEAIHEAGHDHEEGEDHDHEGEEEAHEEGEDHDHDHHEAETLGALYTLDCSEGHDHEGEEEAHEEGEAHEHNHGACDPHVWMEPHNVMYWTMLIRDTLIKLDPANEDVYTANAASYLGELDALAHDVVMPMVESVPEENRILITNHDAFGYFATRYEFEVVGTIIPSLSTLADPSAADVAEIIDLIEAEGVPAIFAETTVSDDLAQQIAEETGAQVYTLYSGSLSEADGPASTYVDYIRYNVTTIVEALGGGI